MDIHRPHGHVDAMAPQEKITRNEEFTDGFAIGAAGYWITENPHKVNSFEWMSWNAGWLKGRMYYMDEGWVVS